MNLPSALLICKTLISENNARMSEIHASGDADEMVSEMDQLVGIATIMHLSGYPVIVQRRYLLGQHPNGEDFEYELRGFVANEQLVGLELEKDWEGIEKTCRADLPYQLEQRLTGKSKPTTLDTQDITNAMNNIAGHFPQWHHWIEEKVSQLGHNALDATTPRATPARPSSRL